MNYTFAQEIAGHAVRELGPACTRIEIAGSVRRQKAADISDIEIVCIPAPAPLAKFGEAPPVSPLYTLTDRLRSEGVMTPRVGKDNRIAWGPKMRRASWHETPLDLFIVTAPTWGVQLTLRTGPADFSRLLVSAGEFGGAMPPGWCIDGGRIWDGDTPLTTPEEKDLFYLLGLYWIDPPDRSEASLRRALRERTKAR